MSNYDWRALPQLKDKYVKSVFDELGMGFPINEASDHFITKIERFWFLKIDKEIAIEMMWANQGDNLNVLMLVSETLDNETKWQSSFKK
tara:strand:+ start:442 stop:708 length:267 start_codon:yes stop_codon:yes gene_type:complete